MRIVKRMAVIVAAALAAASCDWAFNVILPTDPSVFVVNQNTERVELGPEAQVQSVYIASDMLWNAMMKEGVWCKLKEQTYYNEFTSTLSFMVEANNSPDSRTDSLIVFSGNQRKAVAIVQYGYGGVIDTDEITLHGTVPVQYQLKATTNWTLQKEGDWFTVSPTSGSGNKIITVQAVDDNKNLENREGNIVFVLNGVRVTVPVHQGITETIIVDVTEVSIPGDAGSFTVGTHTNVDYQVSIDVPWIKEDPATRSLIDFQHSFIAEANTSSELRTGHITFTYEDITETVTVNQDGADLLLEITTPGFYGVNGQDHVYARLTCQSACVHKGDVRDFRLMIPGSKFVILLEDIPENPEYGKPMQLPLSIHKEGKIVFARPVTLKYAGEDDNLIWFRGQDPSTYVILRKQ